MSYFFNKNWHENSEQPPTKLGNVVPAAASIGKDLYKNKGGMGEINRWGCRRSVSLFCWEREREGETSLPTFTQCDCRSRFLFTAVTMQWAPFLSSLRNCFPCQSKEVEMKAGSMKACALMFLTRLINKSSVQPQLYS